MPAFTQLPVGVDDGASPRSPASPGPPPLEYPIGLRQQQQRLEVSHAPARPQRQLLHPPHAASLPSIASAAIAAALPGASSSSLMGRRVSDVDMGDDEKRPERVPVIRHLRPFHVHQWLDVRDTQDTWLEAQVTAVDPPEAAAAAEAELNAAHAARMAAAASSASLAPVPPLSAYHPHARRIFVHYKSFHSKYDEWLDVSSPTTRDCVERIALLHTHTKVPHPLASPRPYSALGDLVDCKDTINKWCRARIQEFHVGRQQVLVHYEGHSERFDEWINIESYRIQRAGTFTQDAIKPIHSPASLASAQPYRGGPRQAHSSAAPNRAAAAALAHGGSAVPSSAVVTPDQLAKYQASAANELRFREIMRTRLNSEIVDQKEDGLFRSVSHQVYGDARHHALVRAACMSYVEAERHFFEHFIAGETFEEYITRMQLDGEWGDNIELQAMSEIYERPIEIYAYSHVPLKTFMATSSAEGEADGGNGVPQAAAAASSSVSSSRVRPPPPPIRLSYHFASHYNSVVHPQWRAQTAVQPPPGVMEQAAMERAAQLRRMQEQQRAAIAAASSSSSSSPSSLLPTPLSACRSSFTSNHHSLDASALDVGAAASLSELDAVLAAEVATAQQTSLRDADDQQMMQAAMAQSERDDIDKIMEQSAIEAAKEQAAREAADATALPSGHAAAAASAAPAAGGSSAPHALAAGSSPPGVSSVESAVLARALAASLSSAPPSASDSLGLSEEQQLEQALRMSVEAAGGQPAGGANAEEAALQAALRASTDELSKGSSPSAAALPAAVSACVELGFPLEMSVQAFEVCGGGTAEAPPHAQLVERMMDYLCSS